MGVKRKLICSLMVAILIVSNAVCVFAAGFTVAVSSELVTVAGEAEAQSGSDYGFTVALEEGYQLDELYAEISASVPVNKNTGEGEKASTPILAVTGDDTATPGISMVEDNDSPMKDVLLYKRVITDSVNAGTITTYKNQNIASLISDKPGTISLGFWLKESDIETVYGTDNGMVFMIYKSGSYMTIEVPLAALISTAGTSQTITPTVGTIENIFTNYSVSAACTARDNGWAHFVCNLENLTYPSGFDSVNTLFYVQFNNVSGVLRQGNKLEMSNFTFLTNNKVESGYIVYPSSSAQSFKCAPKTVAKGSYAICKEAVLGDIAITAKGSVIPTVMKYDVTFNEIYTEISGNNIASNEEDYTFTAQAFENTSLSAVYAEVKGTMPINRNSGEGTSETTPILAATTDDERFPEIAMSEDTDSPMSGVLSYKRVIKDSKNAGTATTYKNQNIATLISSKPSTISFGFWIKESDVSTVYGEKGMEFWPIYKSGSYMTVSLPLSALIANVGTSQAVTPTVGSIENIFTDYSVSAACTGRDNGWAHIVCNMENLKWTSGFDTTGSLFYLYLANVSDVLRQGNKIEMSNFTFLTNDTIKNGYVVYPQTASESSYKVAPRKLSGGTYAVTKENIKGNMTINAIAAIIPEEGYVPQMSARIEGENLYVRTSFDDEYDLVQTLTGINSDGVDANGNDANEPLDYGKSGLVLKSSSSMTALAKTLGYGVDESAPFYTSAYIGANHGQPSSVVAKSTSHGKTYEDIGSLWTDSGGTKWNLLKVPDEDTLVFISENLSGDSNKYSFKNSLSGTLTCTRTNFAEHTENIVIESATTNQQLFPSINKQELTVKAVINGKKYALEEAQTVECDYIEIVERYQVMNPATIGNALRTNRPEGGYTSQPSLAVGVPLIDYNMTYRITPDGTIFLMFDHTILEEINFRWYGGIQYQLRYDAYSGGVHRYIPKLESFDKTYNGSTLTYDFTEPYNVTAAVTAGNYIGYSDQYATSALWEVADNPPNRQVDYMKDTSGNIKASYAGGYIPVLQGEPSVRINRTSEAMYLYRSGKSYPHFVDSLAFSQTGTKDQKIQGVAYRKYNGAADKVASIYTVPYERDTYIYIDFHEIGEKEFVLSDYVKADVEITELEKSANVSYALVDGKVSAKMEDGTYGYIVLSAKSPVAEPVSVTKDTETGEITAVIKNNTYEEAKVQVIIAGYKGNKLSEVKIEDITLGTAQNYNLKSSLTKGAFDKVKVFVWSGLSDIVPNSVAIEG